MTRRVLLGTGAAVVVSAGALAAAGLTHRLDDVAEAVGIEPTPLPDPEDSRILRRASKATAALLASLEATAAAHPDLALADLEVIGREQLTALGGTTAATDVAAPPADQGAALTALEDAYGLAATQRATDAGEAFSPALVRVLASMSAGHVQTARQLRRLR
ncbi:MAG: hypothetical protein JWR55_879 [Aeromicrobium sp.]|jgi:hypothetical protein|nr:hypothetical protein [Aeromicrobium sp.]